MVITAEVFENLMVLALHWQWERAIQRHHDTIDRDKPAQIMSMGYTTVDKIVRILHGMKILNDKQKRALYKDRRLQGLVLTHSEKVAPGDWQRMNAALEHPRKLFVLRCDLAVDFNRERMLRDMHFFITEGGREKARRLEAQYAGTLTRAAYEAEVKRQDEEKPKTDAGKGAMMRRYTQRVAQETS